MKLKLAHLYPNAMNMYGDRGNVLTLVRRAQWRGIEVEVLVVNEGEVSAEMAASDLFFMGGGQDAQQVAIQGDIVRHKKAALVHAAAEGAVMLTVCGGYQLLGHGYQPHEGPYCEGVGLLDVETKAGPTRFIGNVVVERPDGTTLVGFENHSGLTFLGPGAEPLGRVVKGAGNNGEDGFEGAKQGRLYGTYLHGSLLPKNPALADELLLSALQRRYDVRELEPLEDGLEWEAHAAAKLLRV